MIQLCVIVADRGILLKIRRTMSESTDIAMNTNSLKYFVFLMSTSFTANSHVVPLFLLLIIVYTAIGIDIILTTTASLKVLEDQAINQGTAWGCATLTERLNTIYDSNMFVEHAIRSENVCTVNLIPCIKHWPTYRQQLKYSFSCFRNWGSWLGQGLSPCTALSSSPVTWIEQRII